MAIKKTTKKAAKKVATKKTPAKAAAKKVATKKAVKKVAAKKAPAKKVAKKAPAQKAPAKKATEIVVKKGTSKTTIIANVDVGFGNSLFIRGEGAGLSWDKGTQLENVSPYEWAFSSTAAKNGITFKFLVNDEAWADGENLTVPTGGTSVSSPVFSW